MAKRWFGIILITTLPALVFTHFLLWPPCKENEETVLEPGFLIYTKQVYRRHEIEEVFDIKLFLRDCRFRNLKPKSVQNYTISKGTYLAREKFSMKDVEQFVNNCNSFEQIEFYDDDEPINSLLWYGTIPDFPNDCSFRTVLTYFLDGITNINLSLNKIQLMGDPEMFAPLKNLQSLNLASNLIDNMHEGIFKTLTLIKSITLSRNRIKFFPETLFQHLTKLEEVDLSSNFIDYIPAHAFRGTALEKLNLSYKKLKYLPSNFISDIKNEGAGLKLFYFDCNPWYCGCLKDILLELKELNVRYHSDRINGLSPVCFLKNTTKFECDRSFLFKEYESDQCFL